MATIMMIIMATKKIARVSTNPTIVGANTSHHDQVAKGAIPTSLSTMKMIVSKEKQPMPPLPTFTYDGVTVWLDIRPSGYDVRFSCSSRKPQSFDRNSPGAWYHSAPI